MAELKLNTTTSITDYLKSLGKTADFSSRAQLYKDSGLEERLGKYVSSGAQNTAFLKSLSQQGRETVGNIGSFFSGASQKGNQILDDARVKSQGSFGILSPRLEPRLGPAPQQPKGVGPVADPTAYTSALKTAQTSGVGPFADPSKYGKFLGVTADQALENVMGKPSSQPNAILTPAQLEAQNRSMGRTQFNEGPARPGTSIANEKVEAPTYNAPAFGTAGTPTAADIGLGTPGEAELADLYFNSSEYQATKEKNDLTAQGIALAAQTAREDLEAKYAGDKAKLEETLGRNGLWFSGIRSTQVAALAQSLAMSQNQIDRQTAQKLLESDANFKADILKGVDELFKEAKADNKEALGQLNQAGFAVVGNMIVPTLAAQRYETAEERARITQEIALKSFDQRLNEYDALERQREVGNDLAIKRLNISMQNANTSAERNAILNQIREIALLQKTAVSPGQIISASTGLPVKLTKEQTDYYAGIGTMLDTQVPNIQNLLTKVSTGGVQGRYMASVVGIPVLQNTLSNDQQALIQEISQMNNSLIYLLSGKQINNQEFERLKMQLPSLYYTNEQNATQITSFSSTMREIYNRNLALNGFTVAGSEAGQSAMLNLIGSEAGAVDPLDELASQFEE